MQKQAENQTAFDEVAVLHVLADPELSASTYDCECQTENGCLVVRVYFRKNDLRFSTTAPLIKLYRFFRAGRIGYQRLLTQFGRPDLLHVHMALPAGLFALGLWWRRRVPYLITEHLTDYLQADGSYGRASVFYRLATRMVCRCSRAITAVSPSLLKALRHHHLTPRQHHVIANVVDQQGAAPVEKRTDRQTTLFTACLLNDAQKDISGLLQALTHLVKMWPEIRLWIAGDGPDRADLQILAQDLGLASQVTFLGLVDHDQMERYWPQVDLYVMNSRYETFSVATAEALLHGIPAVVTACGGPEYFINEKTGRIVEVGNTSALVAAILDCLQHRERFDPTVLQRSIQQRFSAKRIGEQYHQVYNQLIRS